MKTGAPLIRIESMRLADRTPICVSTTWLSAERFPDAGQVFASARSMTKLLAHYGIRDYRRASTRITAAIVDATDAARLDLALGRPVLVVDSTDVDTDGKPLVTKRSRFAAERVEFWWRIVCASKRSVPTSTRLDADGATRFARPNPMAQSAACRDPVDRGDRDQDHQDQERNLLPFQHADLLGELQADAAGADDADDGGRARIRTR